MGTIYSHKRYAESWIEVSSQASSSSVSSLPAEDAHHHALALPSDLHTRRRRRLLSNATSRPVTQTRSTSAATSSQEEYEESESESDRIMTSSNENIIQLSEGTSPAAPSLTSEEASSNNAEDDGDDENTTALGVATDQPIFTPPANVFSHPPQSSTTRHTRSLETRTSYFPPHRTSPNRRPAANSYPNRSNRTGHTPYNMISPSHQADHDAALRASLSTLLSCAAAARGLPKKESQISQRNSTGPGSNQIRPSTLRLIPESEIIVEAKPPDLPPRPSLRRRTSADSLVHSDKGKRKASSSKDRRYKKRRADSPAREVSAPPVQPTLMTWVVGAGVVVLFSAISFSAGYAIGREVGRLETMGGKDGIVCGREVSRGLRRLRWGGSSVSVIKV
ncbi:MAG: hypothetical protein Q9164_006987 [Protoblastenia rupestris]